MNRPRRILFVCARNQWRSPTAAAVYRDDPRVRVRSAGVANSARHVVSAADIEWAELICAMEHAHARRLRETFGGRRALPEIHVLDIPDDHRFMDPELIELARQGVEPLLAGV